MGWWMDMKHNETVNSLRTKQLNHKSWNLKLSESWKSTWSDVYLGVEPKIGGFYPQNGCFIMEDPIKMDDLEVFPYFWKHPFGALLRKSHTVGIPIRSVPPGGAMVMSPAKAGLSLFSISLCLSIRYHIQGFTKKRVGGWTNPFMKNLRKSNMIISPR